MIIFCRICIFSRLNPPYSFSSSFDMSSDPENVDVDFLEQFQHVSGSGPLKKRKLPVSFIGRGPDPNQTDSSVDEAPLVPTPPAAAVLSEQQRYVVDLVVNQKASVFFTGSAGTGKTFTLKTIIDMLNKTTPGVYVTALTGIAATLLPR